MSERLLSARPSSVCQALCTEQKKLKSYCPGVYSLVMGDRQSVVTVRGLCMSFLGLLSKAPQTGWLTVLGAPRGGLSLWQLWAALGALR